VEEMREVGTCPIMSAGLESIQYFTDCIEERCAWWVGDRCAMNHLGQYARWIMVKTENEELRNEVRGSRR